MWYRQHQPGDKEDINIVTRLTEGLFIYVKEGDFFYDREGVYHDINKQQQQQQ